MNIVRLIVEWVGWVVVAPVVVWVLHIAFCELASLSIRRWRDFVCVWRIGFYARLKGHDWVPSEVTLKKDNSVWRHLYDRWYWRVKL